MTIRNQITYTVKATNLRGETIRVEGTTVLDRDVILTPAGAQRILRRTPGASYELRPSLIVTRVESLRYA